MLGVHTQVLPSVPEVKKVNTKDSITIKQGRISKNKTHMTGTCAKNREVTFPLYNALVTLHTVLVSPAWQGHRTGGARGLELLP